MRGCLIGDAILKDLNSNCISRSFNKRETKTSDGTDPSLVFVSVHSTQLSRRISSVKFFDETTHPYEPNMLGPRSRTSLIPEFPIFELARGSGRGE